MNLGRLWSSPLFSPGDSETRLVLAARTGSREAFDALVQTHERPLRCFLVQRVGAGAADDVLQETLLAAWLGMPKFARRAGFKAWLYSIAVNKCADWQRRRGRRGRETALEEADRLVAPFPDWTAEVDLRESARVALEQLPADQREIVELYYFAELTLAEIARHRQKNLNTVKSQFYRAHLSLTRHFPSETALPDKPESGEPRGKAARRDGM